MSKSVGDRLPAELLRMLDGRQLARRVGFTVSLLTTDAEGWPRVALLSAGEILARDEQRIDLALWLGTSSTEALTRADQATLACIVDGVAYSIRARFSRGPDLAVGSMEHAYFGGRIEEVLADRVGYALLTSGITYELPESDKVVERWTATVEALRGRID